MGPRPTKNPSQYPVNKEYRARENMDSCRRVGWKNACLYTVGAVIWKKEKRKRKEGTHPTGVGPTAS